MNEGHFFSSVVKTLPYSGCFTTCMNPVKHAFQDFRVPVAWFQTCLPV